MSAAGIQSSTLPSVVAPNGDTITTFIFENHPIRVAHRDARSWFVAADVCEALKLTNPSVSVAALDPDERSKLSLGGRTEHLVVSEGGLYTLILRNRGAVVAGTVSHRFRRWVTDEVLPAIRKTGSYAAPAAPNLNDASTLRTLLLGYSEQVLALEAAVQEKTKALVVAQAAVEEAAPAVEAFNAFLDDTGCCSLSNAARIIGAPQVRFFAWLRARGFVFDQGEEGYESTLPRADLRKAGHFKVRLKRISRSRHVEQTLVTRSGLDYLRLRWSVGPAREIEMERLAARRQERLPGV